MNKFTFCLIPLALFSAGSALPVHAQSDRIRNVQVQFPRGQSRATFRDRIVGYESVSYRLWARAGQMMSVSLVPSNSATYFNVYGPGRGPGGQAIATSDAIGTSSMVPAINRFRGPVPETGIYTVSVYMVRAAARRNERSRFTLTIGVTAGGPPLPAHRPPHHPGGGDAMVPGTEFHATGEVPCARYRGQPMKSCRFGVSRQGFGHGWVKIFWPDGGNRVIFYQGGVPVRYDESQADAGARMTVTRESDLFMIRIGTQRFEIPEAVLTGG